MSCEQLMKITSIDCKVAQFGRISGINLTDTDPISKIIVHRGTVVIIATIGCYCFLLSNCVEGVCFE